MATHSDFNHRASSDSVSAVGSDPASPLDAEVLVVGAGPVGLLTAYRLQSLGISCLILDKRLEPSRASRASTFQPACLDRLAELDLLAPLLPQGRRVTLLRHLALPSGARRDLSFDGLQGQTSHPFRLHLEQHHLCELLLQRLTHLRAPGQPAVLWGQALVGVECNPSPNQQGAVEAWVQRADGSAQQQRLRARWLVAADGARSTVRQLLQLPFEGHDLPAPVLRVMLATLPQAVASLLAGLTYIRHPLGSLSALQMRADWRLILRPGITDVEAALADDRWARQRLGQIFASVCDPSTWLNLPMARDHYSVSQRCLAVRQQGRCVLIGDAAHITNTRGGLNMNFGLLEGLDLAATLAANATQSNGQQQKAMANWAYHWQERTTSVLLARTARLLDSNPALQPNLDHKATEQDSTLLVQSCLLDLQSCQS